MLYPHITYEKLYDCAAAFFPSRKHKVLFFKPLCIKLKTLLFQ